MPGAAPGVEMDGIGRRGQLFFTSQGKRPPVLALAGLSVLRNGELLEREGGKGCHLRFLQYKLNFIAECNNLLLHIIYHYNTTYIEATG